MLAAFAFAGALLLGVLLVLQWRRAERLATGMHALRAMKNDQLESSLGALQDAQRQLVLSEKMASLGVLSAGVAHEINNPLAFVTANLNYVRELLHLSAGSSGLPALSEQELSDLKAALEEGLHGAKRIASIVKDLKTFCRSDPVSLGPVDVRESLSSAIRMTHLQVHQRARLTKDFVPVPFVSADSGRLSQVFLNLLMNACHAIPEGHPQSNEIRVRLFQNAADGTVVTEVQDTGSGISQEVQQHLFEPFFTTKPVGQGMGLGLSVSQGIIHAFGGKIEVESAPGQGSTFRVILQTSRPSRGAHEDSDVVLSTIVDEGN